MARDLWTRGSARSRGRARYRLEAAKVWTPARQEWLIRAALIAFPGSYEIDERGEPIPREQDPPPEQLAFEA